MRFLKNISGSELSDKELADMFRESRNTEVLGLLFQRYMDLVYGVCLKYLKHPENAQDSVMSIFEELIEKLRKHEVENFRSWLHTLAKNHCLMRLRSEKKLAQLPLDGMFMQSDENLHLNSVLEKEENFKKLEHCLGQLAEDQRKIIELFYLDRKCYKDIAALTGIEWNKIRSYIQNGRRNLKLCIEKQKTKSTV